MEEKELIQNLKKLRQIKPEKEWVLLTKEKILGREITPVFTVFKPAFAALTVFGILFSLFVFAQNSLPGDLLYPLKKAVEKTQTLFVSQEEKPKLTLELADKRLKELNQIVQNNKIENLAPALNEFEKTKTEVKKEVVTIVKNKPKEEAVKLAKELGGKLIEIKKKEKNVYATLNTEPSEETNQTAEKTILEILIKDAENSTLTEEQKEDFEKVKEFYKTQEYQKGLEFYLTSSLNKNVEK